MFTKNINEKMRISRWRLHLFEFVYFFLIISYRFLLKSYLKSLGLRGSIHTDFIPGMLNKRKSPAMNNLKRNMH